MYLREMDTTADEYFSAGQSEPRLQQRAPKRKANGVSMLHSVTERSIPQPYQNMHMQQYGQHPQQQYGQPAQQYVQPQALQPQLQHSSLTPPPPPSGLRPPFVHNACSLPVGSHGAAWAASLFATSGGSSPAQVYHKFLTSAFHYD
jgi:hypothetical protein